MKQNGGGTILTIHHIKLFSLLFRIHCSISTFIWDASVRGKWPSEQPSIKTIFSNRPKYLHIVALGNEHDQIYKTSIYIFYQLLYVLILKETCK